MTPSQYQGAQSYLWNLISLFAWLFLLYISAQGWLLSVECRGDSSLTGKFFSGVLALVSLTYTAVLSVVTGETPVLEAHWDCLVGHLLHLQWPLLFSLFIIAMEAIVTPLYRALANSAEKK